MPDPFKIEKGVPIPELCGSGYSKYPFGEMGVGDSVLIKGDALASLRGRSAASYYGSRNNKKFATRQTSDGLRIWRTE